MKNKIHTMDKWDTRFFQMCSLVASWSEDRSRKVGAVIVGPSKEIRSIGFNGLPRRISGKVPNRHSSNNGEKYYWFEHAERNALYNSAGAGISTSNCTIYTNLFPCADCTRAIIQSGIVGLNCFEPPKVDDFFSRSFEVSTEMLEEAGVTVRFFSIHLKLPCPKIFN